MKYYYIKRILPIQEVIPRYIAVDDPVKNIDPEWGVYKPIHLIHPISEATKYTGYNLYKTIYKVIDSDEDLTKLIERNFLEFL